VSLIVTDYEFDHHQHDLELLTHCAAVAADAHAPFIANASPRFFGCERFSDLPMLGDIRRILEIPRYAPWQSFRNSEDARYVALCIPGVSRVFAIQVAASFAKYRGFGALTGEAPDPADVLSVTGQVERDLSDGGFVTLVTGEGLSPRFSSARSAHRPKRFADTAEGRAAAIHSRASAELANVLTISRMAHFVEAIATVLPPGVTADDLERALQDWLSHSVTEALGIEEASLAVTEPGYLRYELTLGLRDRGSGFSLEVAGRLD
jgi:type VI secretion system protein ImpC